MTDTSLEFQALMGEPPIERKPYLNLGAGRLILPYRPGTFEADKQLGNIVELPSGYGRPHHHGLVDAAIYAHQTWVNVDRNAEPGIDQCVDLFTYPWPFEDNSFGGALASHIVEHIPHEICISDHGLNILDNSEDGNDDLLTLKAQSLQRLQDGWYAFFAELYRVLEHGAIVHILAPYGWSQGAITDPTHTRLVTEHTFSHSMQPDPQSPFKYATGGIHFQMLNHSFSLMPEWSHLAINPNDPPEWVASKTYRFQQALQSHINVVYELYVQLRAVKA